MPGFSISYPLINGHRYSYASINAIMNSIPFPLGLFRCRIWVHVQQHDQLFPCVSEIRIHRQGLPIAVHCQI